MSAETALKPPPGDPVDAWRAALNRHLERLVITYQRAERLGLEDWRWTSPASVDVAHQEVAARTREVLRASLEVLEGTQLACQSLLESFDAAPLSVSAAQDIDGFVFAARADLQQFDHLLKRAYGEDDGFVTLEVCQRSSRHLKRSLAAVGRALAGRLGLRPAVALDEDDDLEGARSLRAAFVALRRELRRTMASGAELADQLEFAQVSLSRLLGSDVFRSARLGDKRPLWSLANRIARWQGDERSDVQARQLLGDLAATAELLRGISKREVLARHDLATLELVERTLSSPVCELTEVRELLGRVAGFDDTLDELRATGTLAELRVAVAEVLARNRTQRSRGGVP